MSRLLVIASIAASYFIFAILLNSVGTVILQSIESFGITKTQASVLEGFKDLPIAIVSFLVASFLPRVGFKIAMLIGLVLGLIGCLIVPAIADFWTIKLLFALVGSAFALVKISVYSLIGLLTRNTNEHSSLLNTIEGIFMLGVLSGYWYFAEFIDPLNSTSLHWLNAYWGLAIGLGVVGCLVWFSPIPPAPRRAEVPNATSSATDDFIAMLKLITKPLVLVFILSIFMYVLVEQGIGTWLPTFNREVLTLPADISVQLTSVFAFALAFGRLAAGQMLKLIHWFYFMLICLICMSLFVIVSLPLASPIDINQTGSLFSLPLTAFLFPVIGLFMAPIYPVLNSVVLSHLPKIDQAGMTGLIVVFSALGGTTGSIVTGTLFDKVGGHQAFYTLLIPIAGIGITLLLLYKWTKPLDPSGDLASVKGR